MSFTTWKTAAIASASLAAGMLAGSVTTAPSASAAAAAAAPTSCASLEVIAHRGNDTRGVDQNTVAAYDSAARRGYSIEADVRSDADQVLWMFHDSGTFNATGTRGSIGQMTTSEVEELRYLKAGSPLLKLRDAMTAFEDYPGTRIYLEPKSGAAAGDTADAIVARGQTRTTWITDFGDQARAAQPAIKVLQKVTGALPARPTRFVRDRIGIVAAPGGGLVPRTVSRYQRRGVEVQARNAPKTATWRRTIQAGADAQLTDRPGALTKFCPAALKDPRIAARKSGRTGAHRLAIRGKFFYDVLNVRVADRTVRYKVVSPRRINARIRGIRGKQVSVYVRTPNGAVERTVRLRRR